MFRLETFYQSKEWLAFRKQLIEDRTHEDGFIYDEITKQPIVRAYDLILHHKEELTDENVNDYNVSLNPDNILIVSHKTHNRIHERFGTPTRQQVYIVFGAPLSGKTSWVRENKGAGDLVLDIDSIWECIGAGERYIKPNSLKEDVFAVRDCLLDCVRYRRGKWHNAYVIGGYALSSDRERITRELAAREIFIDTPKEVCFERLEMDEARRTLPQYKEFIEEWFRLYEISKPAEV